MSVLVDDRSGSEPDRRRRHRQLIRQSVRQTLHRENRSSRCEVSVVLGSDDLIQRLNRQFRGVDAPTDVLSFPLHEPPVPDGDLPLGDIVISVPAIQRQSMERGVSVEQELCLMVIHSTLHLLGYDHADPQSEAEMWRKQSEILARTLQADGGSRGVTRSASASRGGVRVRRTG